MKILLADDSRVMRRIVIRALRQAGYAGHVVVEASNGWEALELAQREALDLVLSEWTMPGMNGIDLLTALRASGSTVPFGFVTAERSSDARVRAEACGALFLLAKPFTPDAFEEALAPVLTSTASRPSEDRGSAVTSYLPTPKEVRELLGTLLAREVSVRPGQPLAPTPRNPCTVAVYVDDLLRVTALVALDLGLSARAAAAIGLVPAGQAEAAIDDGVLGETLRDNLDEVLHVTAALVNADGTHVRLYEVHHAGRPIRSDVLARSVTLGRREDLVVDVGGYGSGRLSVVLV